MRVLLAEDNPTNQRVTRVQLESLGVELHVAKNGIDAVAAHQQASFDLIFMDCQMPEMDGFEASRAIRRLEEGGDDHVPIIVLTANALEGDRKVCLEAGMDGHLPKPVTLDQLEATLQRWLSLEPRPRDRSRADRGTTPESSDQSDEALLLDPEQLDALRALGADDDQGVVMEIVELFAADLPGLVAAMIGALHSADAETLRAHAHSLKGSAAYMGARELSKRAGLVERQAAAGNLAGLADPLHEIELLSTRVIGCCAAGWKRRRRSHANHHRGGPSSRAADP